MPHDQKSKSSGLEPSWIDAHSVQPYLDTSPNSRARATCTGRGRPKYAVTSTSSSGAGSVASLQMLPSSKHGSLLPEYS